MPETYTHDDNATSWRDLADAFSPQQVAYLDPRHGGVTSRTNEARRKANVHATAWMSK